MPIDSLTFAKEGLETIEGGVVQSLGPGIRMLEEEARRQVAIEAGAGGVLDALHDAPLALDLEGFHRGGVGAVDEVT